MLERIPIGGMTLRSSDSKELVPFESALLADDCIVDDDCVRARPGYRSAIAGAGGGAVVGAGLAQRLLRFRPGSDSKARAVAAIAGSFYTVTDPSSEVLSDGVQTVVAGGPQYGVTAKICGAQMGNYLFVGSNEANMAIRRLKESGGVYSFDSLESLPAPAQPGAPAKTASSWFPYRAKQGTGDCTFTVANCAVTTNATPGGGSNSLLASWDGVVGTTGDASQPASGATLLVTLTVAQDIRGADYLAVAATPPDSSRGGKQLVIEISADNAIFYPIGTITDVNPNPGSPNVIVCDISQIPDTTKQAFKYIRFTINNINDGTTLRYAVYGHMLLYTRRLLAPPWKYYVGLYNPATGQRSALSPAREVTVTTDDAKLPTYPDEYFDKDTFRSTTNLMQLTDPANPRVWNRQTGKPMPSATDLSVILTFTGNTPAGYTGNLDVELYVDTSAGRRLVYTQTAVASGGAYTLIDNGSVAVLQNLKWKPGGTVTQATCMAARGARLVVGNGNRMYVSSFTAPGQTQDPYPQFPDVPQEAADGWAIDIGPSGATEIMALVDGDSLYIGTNDAVYALNDLSAPIFSVPPLYRVWERGVMAIDAAVWAENAFFWCGHDGVYFAQNRAFGGDLTKDQRSLYIDWLQPDSTMTLGYQARKLVVTRGTRELRYDFVTNRWTRGTLTHTFTARAQWKMKDSPYPQLWYLTADRKLARWQDGATSDMMNGATDGTAKPNWKYSTGLNVETVAIRIEHMRVLGSGPVRCFIRKTTADEPGAVIEAPAGDEEVPGVPDQRSYEWRVEFQGPPASVMKRAYWDREVISAEGQA